MPEATAAFARPRALAPVAWLLLRLRGVDRCDRVRPVLALSLKATRDRHASHGCWLLGAAAELALAHQRRRRGLRAQPTCHTATTPQSLPGGCSRRACKRYVGLARAQAYHVTFGTRAGQGQLCRGGSACASFAPTMPQYPRQVMKRIMRQSDPQMRVSGNADVLVRAGGPGLDSNRRGPPPKLTRARAGCRPTSTTSPSSESWPPRLRVPRRRPGRVKSTSTTWRRRWR